ncbi:ABC transporter permease [Nesterenkonia sandarakina]|uniref:Autoinducer 2 import system permease protein LsrD n=1 Tax=Nesterenkonia sandarakina TaxID=272918 RepID=A0A2T0YN51_9MICC|nr:ABC transporter permease [Nesterenkonia sandarakina]PRZ16750.1 rhamnose transport system permease protein [Nesterenkonia sandarakina]
MTAAIGAQPSHPIDPATGPQDEGRTYAAYHRPWWFRTFVSAEFLIIALLVLVWLVAMTSVDNFSGPLTVRYLLLDIAPLLMIALPMTLIIVTGQIDLSVASTMGLSSVLVGILHVQVGMPIPAAAIMAVLVGVLCGAFNGFLVAYVKLPSLAVTIGTLALYRGVAVGLLGTTALTDFDPRWTDLATSSIGESRIPAIMIPVVILIVTFTVLLHFTPFGRGLYDIGHNEQAAWFSGVNVARSQMTTFVLSGAVAAAAGVFYTMRFGNSRGDNATGLELEVIAAVLLGGVLIFGGRGAIHGVLAGALLIGVLSSALRLEGVTVNVINIIIGLLLVISVLAPTIISGIQQLRSRKTQRKDTSGRTGTGSTSTDPSPSNTDAPPVPATAAPQESAPIAPPRQ